MRIPETLVTLADQGILDEVVRPLMSGKEAEVFLVRVGGQLRVAKVYKEAQNRTFKNRAEYTEGRKTRNSRDQRAIQNRSRHGRRQDEAAWRSTEVDMIYRLQAAGVRVPTPHHFIDGVLIMELITDLRGNPAPRLAELSLPPDEAQWVFERLLAETIRMLCAGVVHGDLSDFNVLMSGDGPVIIDLPQAVDASSNQNARKLLQRDVDNLQRFLARAVPGRAPRPYAHEMWDLYARSLLTPETRLTGRFRAAERRVDTAAVLELIGEAAFDERARRAQRGQSLRGVGPAPPGAGPQPPQRGPSRNAGRPGPRPPQQPQRGPQPGQRGPHPRGQPPAQQPSQSGPRGPRPPRPPEPQRTGGGANPHAGPPGENRSGSGVEAVDSSGSPARRRRTRRRRRT